MRVTHTAKPREQTDGRKLPVDTDNNKHTAHEWERAVWGGVGWTGEKKEWRTNNTHSFLLYVRWSMSEERKNSLPLPLSYVWSN